MESLYSRRSNLIIGFHGCDESVVRKVVNGEEDLIPSTNDYDWLGNGIYFWENNEARALQWATELSKRKGSSIKKPAVVGAIIGNLYGQTYSQVGLLCYSDRPPYQPRCQQTGLWFRERCILGGAFTLSQCWLCWKEPYPDMRLQSQLHQGLFSSKRYWYGISQSIEKHIVISQRSCTTER